VAGENLLAYYAQRARECEQVYEKPERQPDLHQLRIWLQDALAGHRILEIACGTGYWTEAVAPVAAAITATDASPEVLEMAAARPIPGAEFSSQWRMPMPSIASTGHSQPPWRPSGGRTCRASVSTGSCAVSIGDWGSEQS
jgi:hypothetical protein